jgi:hypothetical protein
MSWTRVDDGFARHPKVLRLLARHGVDAYVALGWWVLVLASSRDGTLDPEVAQLVAPGVDPDRILPMLVEVGLVDQLEDGWRFHDWAHYQDRHGRERQVEAGRQRAQGPRDARGRLVSPAPVQLPPASGAGAGTSSSPAPRGAGVQPGSSRPVPVPTPDGVRDGTTPRESSPAPWVVDDPYGLDAQLLTREAPAAPPPLRGPAPPCAADPELFRAHQPAHRLAGATWRACEACGWTAPRLADQLRRHGFDPDSLAR